MAEYNSTMPSGSSCGDNASSVQALHNHCEVSMWDGWTQGLPADAHGCGTVVSLAEPDNFKHSFQQDLLTTWLSGFHAVSQAACGRAQDQPQGSDVTGLQTICVLGPNLRSSSAGREAGSDTSELFIESSARHDPGSETYCDSRNLEEYSKSEESPPFLSRSNSMKFSSIQNNYGCGSEKDHGCTEKMGRASETELNSRTSSPVLPPYGLILQHLIGSFDGDSSVINWPSCTTSSSQHSDSGLRKALAQEELGNTSCESVIMHHQKSGREYSHSSDPPYNSTSCAENVYAELQGLISQSVLMQRNSHTSPADYIAPSTSSYETPSWQQFEHDIPPSSAALQTPPFHRERDHRIFSPDALSTAASRDVGRGDLSPQSTGTALSTILNTCPGGEIPKRQLQRKRSCLDLVQEEETGNSGSNKRSFNQQENTVWPSANFLGRVADSKFQGAITTNYFVGSPSDIQASVGPALNTNGKPRARRGSATDPQSVYARHRRGRITDRLKILQQLVPNGAKVDIVTMLEEAINYVKFLQLQVKLLSSDEFWIYAPTQYNGVDVSLGMEIGMESTA